MPRRPMVTLGLAAVAVVGLGACDSVLHRGELPSLDHFEGELDVMASGTLAKGTTEPTPVTVFVKDDKLRFDPPSAAVNGGGSFLIDSPARHFFVINPDRRQAIQFTLSTEASKTAVPLPAVTKTGRKSTVAGFACEEWDVTDANHRKDTVCVANKPASFFDIPVKGGILGSRAWMSEVFDGQHVPLRLVAFDNTGAESGRLELIRIARKPEDAALFGVGEGVQVTDIASLLGGRGGPSHESTQAAAHAGSTDTQGTKIQARPSHS
jgi:hypothetical protein